MEGCLTMHKKDLPEETVQAIKRAFPGNEKPRQTIMNKPKDNKTVPKKPLQPNR